MALPWNTLASVKTPEGALELRRRGEKEFLITIDNRILMTSKAHRSEVALAELGCAELREKKGARVLVSGLGMGYTLRAALDQLADDAKVVVAELNPVVVEWCKGPLSVLIEDAANDPRVTMHIGDVAKHIAKVEKAYDAIVLDMYEGPQTNVKPNDPLYGPGASRNAKKALVPKGVYAIWGEVPSAGFERSLEGAGFTFRAHRPSGRGALRHCVYVARAR